MVNPSVKEMLLKQFGIENAEEGIQEQFLVSLEELISKSIVSYIIKTLNPKISQQFLDLLEADESGTQALAFARQQLPDYDNLIAAQVQKELAQLQQ